MYGKLFAQMYDGTLATKGPWEALVTFQQLIILADKEGTVDMTPEAMSRRTTIPLEVIKVGLDALLQPDPESRTPDEGGRRIVPLDPGRPWGWRIVNYAKYRAIRSAEDRRDYHRQYWRKRHATQPDSTVTQQTHPIAEVEVEVEVEKLAPSPNGEGVSSAKPPTPARQVPNCPQDQIVALYHEILQAHPRVLEWTPTRQALLRTRWREMSAPNGKRAGYTTAEDGLAWWRRFFLYVSDSPFLTGKVEGREGRPFVADLEWMIRPKNFPKVYEGRYHTGGEA